MRTGRLQWIEPDGRVGGPTALRAAEDVSPADQLRPAHDPRLTPRDEVVFLLHTATEVEHALLAQYLYAAWSVLTEKPEWAVRIMTIAKQEMGHLITVENILRALGGPLNFEREDYPFRTDFYPFHFRLEPLSLSSLAKYVLAEMPETPDLQPNELEILRWYAGVDNERGQLNRVGALYKQIRELIGEKLTDDDFRPETAGFQADFGTWFGVLVPGMIIQQVTTKAAALDALCRIAEQGEGMGACPGMAAAGEPHFVTFRDLFRERHASADPRPLRLIAANPSTESSPSSDPDVEQGRITHPRSRGWAQLFNLRYRMLLADLAHALHLGSNTDEKNHSTGREALRDWTFDEMRHLQQIAQQVILMPQRREQDAGPPFAGPPFELPYSLALPDLELGRWLLHRDLIRDSTLLITALKPFEPDATNLQYLEDLITSDQQAAQEVIDKRIQELKPSM